MKAIFFDVDGTLVDTNTNKIPASTLTTLKALQDQGYLICIATGRPYHNLTSTVVFDSFAWDGYICANGQEVLDKNHKYIYKQLWSDELVEKMLKIAKDTNHTVLLIRIDGWGLVGECDENVKIALKFLREPTPQTITYQKDDEVLSMVIFGSLEDNYQVFNIDEITVLKSYTTYADMVLSSASKQNGIHKFLATINEDDYIAFGDSMNDYQMLKGAKVAVAMGNGDDKLKSIASYVTTAIDNDGIQNACIKLGLIKEEEK